MSFLYDKRTRKAMKYIWIVLAIIIMISMVLLFAPGIIPNTAVSAPF